MQDKGTARRKILRYTVKTHLFKTGSFKSPNNLKQMILSNF